MATTAERLEIKSEFDLEQVLHHQMATPASFLGEILVEQGSITREILQRVLERQKEVPGRHLGDLLIEMGFTTTEQINIALGSKLGIPYVKLSEFDIDPKAIAMLPADIALQYNVLPLALIKKRLIVATENPFDWEAMDVVRFHVNCNVEMVLSSANDISLALSRYYSNNHDVELLDELSAGQIDPDQVSVMPEGEQAPLEIEPQEAMRKPVVRLLNALLMQAVIRQASDINIRPEKHRINIYYRVDGKLQFVRSLHKGLLLPLVSRIKIISQMDIAERRLPQDGHARLVHDDNVIDLRMSVIPTVNGESVVIRLLDKEVGVKSLDHLGFQANDLAELRRLISKSYGILLVTGPTGSGKSTTLYALLNEIKKYEPHIITVEDPVEYNIDGVEQIKISTATGYTFAEALRHILRHDPDVIMVGEIRDMETAKIANKAALTGHLVLSSVHTNDAASTITRLVDMGVEPYLLATTLLGVLAQRLVRVNCTHCLVEEQVDPVVRQQLGIASEERFHVGKGCPACNYSGYHGRTIVYELLPVTREIANLVRRSPDAQDIKQCAITQGMNTLTHNALTLARQGRTSIEEVYATRLD